MEKILIVDDSILNLTVLSRILEPDFQVVTVQDGADAILEATLAPPNLILLDLILRGVNGFEILERLKGDPRTKDIPVIIITGLENPDNEERALQYGAVDFIAKPFRPRVVRARVHTHVELYRLRCCAERMAMFDGLTEIPNRRSFDRQYRSLWEAARHEGMPFSVALSDIDFFKGYNDRYGHPAGDDVIRAVALTMHQTILSLGGFVARYGGEECAFLLPRFSSPAAKQIADTARKNVASLALPYDSSSVAPYVTISIGGVTISAAFDGTLEAALEAADRLLYEAKDAGRNCIRWASLPE